jgi:uncharacterized oligopeptide transporter (OPT) family protein
MFGTMEAQTLVEAPDRMRSFVYRPTGIGMLIGAAIGGILTAFPLMASAIGSLRRAKGNGVTGVSDEMPIKLLAAAVLVGAAVLIVLAYSSVPGMSFGVAITMALLGTLWMWIAGVIVAECIGRTNWSPLSGMTLIAVTILIVIAKSSNLDNPQTIVSSLVVGVAICLAISQASDMMLDLKSGYLIGAIPRRQQFAQFIGAWLGPIVVIALMFFLEWGATPTGEELDKLKATAAAGQDEVAYGIGSENLPAAQANALASVISGIVQGDVPTYRYLAGCGLGFLLAISGLGGIGVMVALGFYMPFDIVLTYTIGCLLRVLCNRFLGQGFSEEKGIPIAAGLIVGEALVGVGITVTKVFS